METTTIGFGNLNSGTKRRALRLWPPGSERAAWPASCDHQDQATGAAWPPVTVHVRSRRVRHVRSRPVKSGRVLAGLVSSVRSSRIMSSQVLSTAPLSRTARKLARCHFSLPTPVRVAYRAARRPDRSTHAAAACVPLMAICAFAAFPRRGRNPSV